MILQMRLICMITATISSLIFLGIWLAGYRKKEYMIQTLDEKKYMSKIIIPFGLQILDSVKYSYTGMQDKTMIKNCIVVYGEKYAMYYYQIHLARMISVGYVIVMVSLIFTGITGSVLILGLGIFLAAGMCYYYHTLISDVIKYREESIVCDFPEVLSKLALLVNAGMILREAWEKIAFTGEGVLYTEMKQSVADMQNGTSEIEAYMRFSKRCGMEQITKFTSILVQNLSKGNKELVEFLKMYSSECWDARKHQARRKGEEASGKMIIPMGIMFLGLLLMIIIPVFSGIGM